MAEDNQNEKEHSTSSFKDQILRSLHGEQQHTVSEKEKITNDEKKVNDSIQQPSKVEELPTEERSTDTTNRDQAKSVSSETGTRTTAMEPKMQIKKREERIVSKIVLMIASVLILVMLVFGFTFYKYVSDGLKPLNTEDTQLVQVYIPSDSSNKQIATILEDSKVIKSALVFNYYAKFKNLSEFQAGYYQMSPSMTLDEIGQLLREGGTAEATQIADGKVTIPEGYDIDQISEAIAKNTSFNSDEVIALMQNEEFFTSMYEKYPELLASASEAQGVRYRLEGYLFPATYNYYKDMSLESFIEQMIEKTSSVMETYTPLITAKGMTNQQVLTLASLVEKEGIKEEDRRKIAQVFFNRLDANMPLQSDISILYALGEHKEVVTYADLEVDSPYNLYKNTGYGPGPFDNPSSQAINAVLNPIENNYLYFLADVSTGTVYFSETYEQHQELEKKYVNTSDSE